VCCRSPLPPSPGVRSDGFPGTPGTPVGNSYSSTGSDLHLAMQATVSAFKRDLPEVQLDILELIGSGGHGNVYRGIWKGLEVAVKTIVFQDKFDDGKAERVFKEAAIACNMNHEHIVNTFTHELKRMASQRPGELVDFKLYIIQVLHQPVGWSALANSNASPFMITFSIGNIPL
jgi:serine/threonine protein kinase